MKFRRGIRIKIANARRLLLEPTVGQGSMMAANGLVQHALRCRIPAQQSCRQARRRQRHDRLGSGTAEDH